MTKKILYFVLLSVLIMSVGYDIQTGRIQFGSSKINDSTSALMTMNKGALINGEIRSKTNIYIPDSYYFYIGDNNIKGIMNNMQYFSTAHTFLTQSGSTMASFDSATGITFTSDFIPAWTKNNSSVNSSMYEKVKIVAGKLPATVATNISFAHGITNWHTIRAFTVAIQDDSSNTLGLPGVYSDFSSGGGKLTSIAFIDSLNCNVRLPALALNLVNDSVFFRIVYTDFDR